MKVTSLWVSGDHDVAGRVIQATELITEDKFPEFQTCFTESRRVELERWNREHKDLAARQDAFMLNFLCLTYCDILSSLLPENIEALAPKMGHAFDSLVAQRHIQYMRIFADSREDVSSEAHPITAVYQYMVSMKIHTIHISNASSDQ